MMITSVSNQRSRSGNTIPWIAGRPITSSNTFWSPSRIHQVLLFTITPPIIAVSESTLPTIKYQTTSPAIHITQGESQFPHSFKKPRNYGARP